MNAREQWQALQHHLSSARIALEGGDLQSALQHVDSALRIDPHFLVAQTFRERILAPDRTRVDASARADVVRPRALVSTEGLAQFEARARQRRVEHRAAAAREHITHRRWADARAALDEIREVDAAHPERLALDLELQATEHVRRATRSAPWFAAAAAFGGILLAASWLYRPAPRATNAAAELLPSRPIAQVGALAPDLTVAPTGFTTDLAVDSMSIDGVTLPDLPSADEPVDAANLVANVVPAPPAPSTVPPVASPSDLPLAPVSAPILPPPAPAPTDVVPAPPALAAPSPSAASAAREPATPPTATVETDEALVRQVLQRYRSAYEDLDARVARSVWPGVNEAALERAFQGLESQDLTFDACDVHLRGAAATAVCRGTMKYVPKVGSREPHVEPRVWNFTLHKAGDAWQIDSARTER